ncbi:proton-conducting transporter membrane subunit [Cuniculiplasma sp. SKW3]|uniref:proton-conducting transporter transmembrane domain-containing protein n=1 Tax=unclassified Cuniculiplasma TaxID=2619706 RepID=UPI003FD5CAD5
MNQNLSIIYLILIVPVLFSFSYFFSRSQILSMVGSIITVILGLLILAIPLATYSYFVINQVNRILIISVSVVYSLSIFFASTYHSNIGDPKRLKIHYSLMHLFTFTMLFTLLINNFGLMWIGIEATTASSALLLIIERERNQLEAAWRYVLIVSTGLTIALISIILLFLNYHTLEASKIISMRHSNSMLLSIAGVTALVGFGTKIGIFPMHSWLPDAHGEAPSEISAMFSGILLPVAAYVLYEFYEATYTPVVKETFIIFILATLIFVALIMPSQRNIKRMFAYSTMENMAIILLGLITGGIAILGAILVILTHAFGKSSAFFTSGNIIKSYGSKNMESIRGLRDRMPYTAATLLGSSLIVTGAPPFTVFVGEFLILYELIVTGNVVAVIIISICLFIISLSVISKVSKIIFDGNEEFKEQYKIAGMQGFVALISLLFGISILVIFMGGML